MKFSALLKYEFLKLYKQDQLPQNFLATIALSAICLSLIVEVSQINQLSSIFLMLYIPCTIIANCSNLFYEDQKDGTLDFNLLWHGALNLVLARVLALATVCFLSLMLYIIGHTILFNTQVSQSLIALLCSWIISTYTISLTLLISATKIYFNNAKSYALVMLLPLLIPQIIICGMLLQSYNPNLLLISLGMLVVFLPIAIVAAAYLLENI